MLLATLAVASAFSFPVSTNYQVEDTPGHGLLHLTGSIHEASQPFSGDFWIVLRWAADGQSQMIAKDATAYATGNYDIPIIRPYENLPQGRVELEFWKNGSPNSEDAVFSSAEAGKAAFSSLFILDPFTEQNKKLDEEVPQVSLSDPPSIGFIALAAGSIQPVSASIGAAVRDLAEGAGVITTFDSNNAPLTLEQGDTPVEMFSWATESQFTVRYAGTHWDSAAHFEGTLLRGGNFGVSVDDKAVLRVSVADPAIEVQTAFVLLFESSEYPAVMPTPVDRRHSRRIVQHRCTLAYAEGKPRGDVGAKFVDFAIESPGAIHLEGYSNQFCEDRLHVMQANVTSGGIQTISIN